MNVAEFRLSLQPFTVGGTYESLAGTKASYETRMRAFALLYKAALVNGCSGMHLVIN